MIVGEDNKGPSADPEERAFKGGADLPPAAPDQPSSENEELLRKETDPPEGADGAASERPGKNPRGEYGDLPGYGG